MAKHRSENKEAPRENCQVCENNKADDIWSNRIVDGVTITERLCWECALEAALEEL